MSSNVEKSIGGGKTNKAANNPLVNDDKLRGMVERVIHVNTARIFQRWRSSFLNSLERFLEEENVRHAQQEYSTFSQMMDRFTAQTSKVLAYVESGELSVEKLYSAVKPRNALNEWAKMMTQVIDFLEGLIPSTTHMEKVKQYNKFHMGAVLVRNNFQEYARLTTVAEILNVLRKRGLEDVADRQVLQEMERYETSVQKFADVMADLSLYEVMLKCLQFANQNDTADLIFLDCKTGCIGYIGKEECVEKKILHVKAQEEDTGNDLYQETAADEENQTRILKLLRENVKLGLGFGNANNLYDENSVKMSEAEKVKDLWGVQLRKTLKNQKGQELVFVCPTTKQFGELSRMICVNNEVITEIQDDHGKVIIAEAEVDFDERASLVEQIRSLIDVGVETAAKETPVQ